MSKQTERLAKKIESLESMAIQNNVSNEGFLDVLSDIKDRWGAWQDERVRKRKKPNLRDLKRVTEGSFWIRRNIERTYANRTWLEARTFATDTIELSPTQALNLDYGKNFTTNIEFVKKKCTDLLRLTEEALGARNRYFERFHNAVLDELDERSSPRSIVALSEAFVKDFGSPADLIKRCYDGIDELLPSAVKVAGMDGDRGLVLESITPKKQDVSSVPPLTVDNTTDFAKHLSELIKMSTDAGMIKRLVFEEPIVDIAVIETDEDDVEYIYLEVDTQTIRNSLFASRNKDLEMLADVLFWNRSFEILLTDILDQILETVSTLGYILDKSVIE